MRRSLIPVAVSTSLAVALLTVGFVGPASGAPRPRFAPLGLRSVSASPSLQQAELTASDGKANDSFGVSIAVSGSTAVAGADQRKNGTGAAYVFVRAKKKWSQQAILTASDGATNDSFGDSVSISGDTAVVGADGRKSLTGAAYVFVRSGSTWSQQAELKASDGAKFDEFGVSVAVSGDTAVVGAYQRKGGIGAVYVFTRSGSTWSQQAELTAADGAQNSSFGYSVALSGSTAVVGAFARNSFVGAAYVFFGSGSTWSQQAELTASDGATDDYFGSSVAVSGSTAVVGAVNKNNQTGAAYVFVRVNKTWSQQKKLTASDAAAGDNFGTSVAVSRDTALVGASSKNSVTGAAYVFQRSGSTWSQQAELTASDGVAFDGFGSSAGISGSTAVFGAPYRDSDAGAVYVFVAPW